MTLQELKQIVDNYPFFQTARLLYVANLHKLRDPHFNKELKRASLYVPDRYALFNLTESQKYDLGYTGSETPMPHTDGDNRTLSIIDSFLSGETTIETEDQETAQDKQPSLADLTNDYVSFLMKQDTRAAEHAEHAAPQLKGSDLIDSFILETQGKLRLQMQEEGTEEFTSPEFSEEEEEIYTESMVNIYIKQGRYQQALEILRKICMNNPKKNSNFASQIKLLEIITSNKQ